ncbi:MAG: PilN domain-containing protein [Bacteriovoracales bacterium]|nr:PilN domain-containing protein [Bacteriovoracales bacterium]
MNNKMIKINILPTDGDAKGLGEFYSLLLKINVKMVLLSIVLLYASYFVLNLYTKGIEEKLEAKITSLEDEKKALDKEISKYGDVEKQIQKILDQEKVLKKRKNLVNLRVKSKKNPVRILTYISKNIPDKTWIEKLSLSKDKIDIEGITFSYKSIDTFIENLNESIYFKKDLKFDGLKTIVDKESGARSERFKISGEVVKYK